MSEEDLLIASQIPTSNLIALLETSAQMKEVFAHGDRKYVLDKVVELGQKLLHAGSCAIFLAEHHNNSQQPNYLRLESFYADQTTELPNLVEFPIRSLRGGGISAHVAKSGKILRLNAKEIDDNPYVRSVNSDYLKEGRCFSSINIPLKDRKNILLGVIKVINKKGIDGKASPQIEFTEMDELLMTLLSRQVIVLLENLRVKVVIDDFMKDMQNARKRDSVPILIAKSACDLLRADRSDLVLWQEEKRQLIYEAVNHHTGNTDDYKGKVIKEESFLSRLWHNPDKKYSIGNYTLEDKAHHANDSDIRSHITLRIEENGKKFGIINIESSHLDWFGDQDLQTLQTLAQHAALSIQVNKAEQYFNTFVNDVLENHVGNPEEILKKILLGIRESYGFEGGIFYIANENEQYLRCLAYMGVENLKKDPAHFIHDFDSASLAGHVFRSKRPYFSKNPANDPSVDKKGLKFFKINSPILGIPLLFRGEVKGVLTIWSKENPAPNEEDIIHLEPFARLAAAKIAMSHYENERDAALRNLEESRALYHSLINNLPQSVFRKNHQFEFTSINKSFHESLSLESDDVIGKTDYDFYPSEIASEYIEDDKKVMESRIVLEKEEKHQTKFMKSPQWVQVIKTPVVNSKNEVTGIQAIFWDITEKKMMRERYRSLVEQSPDSIILYKEGVVTLANQAALNLFGIDNEHEIKSLSILDFIHPSYKEKALKQLKRLEQKEIVSDKMVEMKILRKNGSTVDVEVYAQASPAEKEVQIVFHDLTRIKQILREMHHRVRRSLSEISNFLELQKYNKSTPKKAIKVFNTVFGRINAMKLVHEILYDKRDVSKVPMRLYFNKLTKNIFDAYNVNGYLNCAIEANDVSLSDKQAKACGLIVNELISNSILHAFDDTIQEKEIKLTLKLNENGNYRLFFSDNGIGIKHKNSNRKSLGLTLVKQLVQNELKGEISHREKNGLIYIICFPPTNKKS